MGTIMTDMWGHIESLKPAFISKSPHFNFITVHYFYIIGMVILSSVCLFIRGGIPYIDALFLASGASTQSGLNTIDINKLDTRQQLVFFFVSMMTNPIAINSFVVFLRLYWFEKRFQHIAREAKKNRGTRSKTKSQSKVPERDVNKEERGVNGRSIVVMHETTRPNGMTNDGFLMQDLAGQHDKVAQLNAAISSHASEETSKKTSTESGEEEQDQELPQSDEPTHHPQIKFADQVKRSNGMADEPLRSPIHHSPQERNQDHISFLQRQRNPDDRAVLRIPGPRDADAGVAPQTLDEDDDALERPFSRRNSTFSSRRGSDVAETGRSNADTAGPQPTRRGNITFTEPARPDTAVTKVQDDTRAAWHTLGALRFRRRPRILKGDKLHADEPKTHPSRRVNTLHSIKSAFSKDKEDNMPYLSWEPTVGRNSAFIDLTEEQREELGGIEYRSLKSLALILTLYYWGFTLFGVVGLVPWILNSEAYGAVVTNDGQGKAWWGIFTANSAFTDLGYTLTPDSMISFQTAVWPLLLTSFLIIIGNTGFPIMLRVVIWVTSMYVPRQSGIWEELKFLMDHPRRCFTLLFPAKATWWLFWVLVTLNGLDLLFFIVLDLGNTIVTHLPVHIRVLDGWFQAVSTRTAGFAVVNLAELHPAIQVSYLIMMYISVLPIAISVRRTNVYEEKSLGIYSSSQANEDEDEDEPSYVGAHLRRQLSFDLWFIFLGFFIIAISEGNRIQSGDPAFTMFSVLFEIVSSYGTVGLSLGYTNINASFSAEFGVIAKLVIIGMQIRGRHRGLPYELDRAILLPSEHLQQKEANDDAQRIKRRASSIAMTTPGTKEKGRRPSSSRGANNFLGTVLHPGPPIPISHRHDTIQRASNSRADMGNVSGSFWGRGRYGEEGQSPGSHVMRVESQAIDDD